MLTIKDTCTTHKKAEEPAKPEEPEKPNKPEKPKKKENKSLEIIYQEKEEVLKQSLATKVSVTGKGNGSGKIEIEFFSHDDFDRLMDILTRVN